ncbi:TATA element modulatory factor 1 DNA binding-domain-containing protein [Bisporella sp. PMI_857]|nr:TATA element modulatory factor 1 DNA binding-domain-containing protein [Bisporella sp. PMI_857]
MSGRWGSFLQQAVAGVESRLDTILAEGQEESNSAASTKKVEEKPKETLKPESVSRSASGNRANDRLQERLARAVAAKNAAQKGKVDGTANKSVSTPPRTGSPALKDESPRTSVDTAPPVVPPMAIPTEEKAPADLTEEVADPALASRDTPSIEVQNTTEGKTGNDVEQGTGAPTVQEQKDKKETEQDPTGLLAQGDEGTARLSVDSARSSLPRDSIDSNRPTVPGSRSSLDVPAALVSDITADQKDPADYEALLKQVQSDFEASELQRQEEIHDYVERIDALQAKLQYLAKESAEAAKKASNAAASGSLEKKLADKDEQVALLMEEGQKLSKKELTHLSTIKKLRARIQQDNKELMDAKSKQEKAEKDVAFANERLKRAESSEKRVNEKQRQINQLQKDIESLKSERDSKDSTIASLKRQLDDAAAEEKKAEVKATNEALVAERRKVADLEDDVANLKIEKNLLADRLQGQIKELREKIDKDAERSRMLELEMKSEQQNLESKLEVMRARAEEVTTGATGDAQAKLLRQIETLQTQYAVASENWQGIEASLIARAAGLEKERDEATRREADIRKKAREVTLKAKRNEDELEESSLCKSGPKKQNLLW